MTSHVSRCSGRQLCRTVARQMGRTLDLPADRPAPREPNALVSGEIYLRG
jgi:hypothetical protein